MLQTERHDPAPERTKRVDASVESALEVVGKMRAELHRNGNGRVIARAVEVASRCGDSLLNTNC